MTIGSHCEGFFLEESLNDPVKAEPALEFVGSEYTGSGTPLSHHVDRMLFQNNDDGEGSS